MLGSRHDNPAGSKSPTPLIGVLLPLLTVVLVTALLYLPSYSYKFSIIDDSSNIFQNPYIETPGSQDIGYLWRHSYYALYMPITFTLWGWLASIAPYPTLHSVPPGGINASHINVMVFHIASIVLHTLDAALVFAILRRFRFLPWPCAAGALLFAAHPVQVQSVAWITGMNNLTGGLFSLSAVYLYLWHIPELDDPATASAKPKVRHIVFLLLATLAFIAALLSKPTSTLTPFLVVVIEAVALRRPLRKWLGTMIVWSLLSIACVVTVWFTSMPVSSHIWSPLWGRLFIVGDALAFYVVKLVFPFDLTLDYGRSPRVVLGNWWGYITWILPAALFVGAVWLARYRNKPGWNTLLPWIYAGLLLFVAALMPVLGIIPFYTQKVSTVCDRYLYLALLGPAVALAAILSRSYPSRRIVGIGTCLYLAILMVETTLLLPAWRDMNTQTERMLADNPDSAMAHQNNGMIILEKGDMAGALPEFEAAMRLDPEADNHAYFTGIALVTLGRQEEAVAPLRKAFDIDPAVPRNWFELWNDLTYLHRYPEAEAVIRRHLSKVPEDGMAQFSLAKTLTVDHRPTEALPYLENVARHWPREGAVQFFLGSVLEQLNRPNDAIAAYQRALALDPGRQPIIDALQRLQHGSTH